MLILPTLNMLIFHTTKACEIIFVKDFHNFLMIYQVYRIFPKCSNAIGRFIHFSIFCLSSEKSLYDNFPTDLIRSSLFTRGKRNRFKERRLDGAPFVEIKWRYARNNNEYLVRFSILIHRMSPWTKFEDTRGNCHWEELRGRALRGEKKKKKTTEQADTRKLWLGRKRIPTYVEGKAGSQETRAVRSCKEYSKELF